MTRANRIKRDLNFEKYFRTVLGAPEEEKEGRWIYFCPFHKDKNNPNLTAQIHGQGLYYCFRCKEGGDIIHFHKKYFGVTFNQALKELRTFKTVGIKSGK